MPVIYIDVLFMTNFLIDFMLFYITARLAGKRIHKMRFFLACLAGGIYSVCIFFPRLSFFQSAIIKILASSLLVRIAFRLKHFKDFLFMLGIFYTVNFVFAGGVTALMSFTDFGAKTDVLLSGGSLYIDLPFLKLFIITAILTVLLRWGIRAFRKSLQVHGIISKLTVFESGNTAEIYGIIDTGNSLYSHGLPVCVVQFSAIAGILPKDISRAVETGNIAGAISSSNVTWAKKLRLVSYSSIGTKNGILIGFAPEKVSIETSDKPYDIRCVIAVYPGKLKYSAILNPDMIYGKGEYNGHCSISAKKGKANS
ncbi:MAG: sigma-E processing peptidase SpoIIGA [Clostridia bacterium]|nr:sigma-E processing peptidase SpoIIGA [Clostridia bacterium]